MRASRMRVALLGLLGLLVALPSLAGELRGRVVLPPGLALADVAPVVVYLELADGSEPSGAAAREPAEGPLVIRQRDARFHPSFLAIAAGDRVAMPNEDPIYHNVFSYSTPNDFDLGLYPEGDSKIVTFRHPGVVRIYCSIHESMSGLLFVAPSRWFEVVSPSGEFAIPGVPAGEHLLHAWSPRLPEASRPIRVERDAPLALELELGPGAPAAVP